MTNNRIRELRKKHNLSQEDLSAIINSTQQTVSRLESGVYSIPSNMLIKMATFFHVTTDYILGISDVKCNINIQESKNEEFQDILFCYQNLSEINRKTLRVVLERLEQSQGESDGS